MKMKKKKEKKENKTAKDLLVTLYLIIERNYGTIIIISSGVVINQLQMVVDLILFA